MFNLINSYAGRAVPVISILQRYIVIKYTCLSRMSDTSGTRHFIVLYQHAFLSYFRSYILIFGDRPSINHCSYQLWPTTVKFSQLAGQDHRSGEKADDLEVIFMSEKGHVIAHGQIALHLHDLSKVHIPSKQQKKPQV